VSLPVRRDGERFSDSASFDFTDPEGGASGLVRVDLQPAAARAACVALVLAGDSAELAGSEVDLDPPGDWGAVELDGLRVCDDGERARVALEDDRAGLEIELTRLGGAGFEPGSAFSHASGLTQELSAARVDGEWRAGDSAGKVGGLGRTVRTSGELDWDRIELVRSLCAVLEDGSLLAVAAARPAGASGHGEEAASALLLDPEASLTRFEEALLSTEYDSGGCQRRAGVELWGSDEDAAALRGAGVRVGGAAAELGGTRLETAFFSFTLDGAPGTARYDLMRGA
jgi:hypothetical protein